MDDLRRGIRASRHTDYFRVSELLDETQLSYLVRTREFVDREVLPVINGYWERAEFPWPLVEKLAALEIVGDGEFKEWLERLADNLMLSSHVEFIPWIQHEDLAQVYQDARVMAVPSVFEPFGMVALEAMACKRPVVASRTGGLKELVQHAKAGFLAEPKDHLDLAQWIMTLLSDSELRRRMGEAGHARVSGEGYTWPAIAEQFLALYQQLLEAPPNRKEPSEGYVYLQQILSLALKSEYYDWSRFMGRLFSKD